MQIKVSHESPINILDLSLAYNDYDYALVHLLESEPQYKSFFMKSRARGRTVLLDNSIFELGSAFDSGKYIGIALELKPNLLIVPDVLENSSATRESWSRFTAAFASELTDTGSQLIGAVQGKTWNDILRCYQFMSEYADTIAISFDFSYYQYTGEGKTQLERMMSGRQRLIEQLIACGAWNWKKPHHLLGCSLAREFRFYIANNIHNIVSCDTSNPIVAGLHNLAYNDTFGLSTKPSIKLADLINVVPTQDQIEIILHNVEKFKNILGR